MADKWWMNRFRRLMTGFDVGDDPIVREIGYVPFDDPTLPERFAGFLADADIQVFYTHVKNHQGKMLYPSKVGPTHPFLGERDFFGEFLEACHKRDIKCCGMMQVCYDVLMSKRHPEWAQVDEQGRRAPTRQDGWYCCFNNPERAEYFLALVDEAIRRYDMDGLAFDEFKFLSSSRKVTTVCYCEHCKRRFREKHGFDIPPGPPDVTQAAWRAFIAWRYETRDDFARRLRETCNAVRPEMPITHINVPNSFQNYWKKGVSTAGTAALVDFICNDQSPKSALNDSERFKYYRAMVPGPNDHTLDLYVGDGVEPHYKTCNWCDAPHPDYLLATQATALGVGASTGLDTLCPNRGLPTETQQQRIKQMMAWTKKLDEWLPDTTPLSSVGLVNSEATCDFYGGDSPSLWRASYLGCFKALTDSTHLFDVMPTTLFLRRGTTIPKNIRVLVLPNLVFLTDEEIEITREFVANGGGVVATGMTSLGNEEFGYRQNFALADVFGVDYLSGREEDGDFLSVEDREATLRLISFFKCTSDHDVVKGVGHEGVCHLLGPRLKVRPAPDAEAHALLQDEEEAKKTRGLVRYPKSERLLDKAMPLVVTHEYKKGRAVYFAIKPGAQYATNGIPWARELLDQAVRWAAGAPLPIRADVPNCIEVNAFRQAPTNRLLVHLVNFQSAPFRTMKPFFGKETVPAYRTEAILPVSDLKVRVAKSLVPEPKNVYLAPGREKLACADAGEDWEITVPNLHIHGVVVVE